MPTAARGIGVGAPDLDLVPAEALVSVSAALSASATGQILREGSRGQAVRELQRALDEAGFNPGPVDGIFGPVTRRAVTAFQRAAGITVDGIVGPQTWGALERAPASAEPGSTPPTRPGEFTPPAVTLRQGSRGSNVRTLQRALAEAGFSPGPVDGSFGPMTRAAVVAFQRARGLVVDGIVGRQTWTALAGRPPETGSVNPTNPGAGGYHLEVFPVAGGRFNIGYDRNWDVWGAGAHHNTDYYHGAGVNHPDGHLGIDIFGPRGAPLVAPVTGEVVKVERNDTGKGGLRVTIRRGNTYFYMCHMDTVASDIRVGQRITAGTPVGTLGKTGNARGTAPHLHFSIYTNGNYSSGVDPFPYLMEVL